MLTLISPAKINLFLQVLHRRPDGYHELASLFQTISLHDTLSFKFSDHDHLICSDSEIPVDGSNLILKAVHLFRLKTNLTTPLSIHLEKRIPQKAGLGGGSSNAATTLFALNELFQHPLTISELQKLGSEIGSDVAFFFSEGTAYCTGRGEIIQNLPPFPRAPVFIVKPHEGLSTPLIFQNMQPSDFSRKDPKSVLKSFFSETPDYFNDLENPSFRVLPALKHLKSTLKKSGFDTVLMSGSGSSFFCLSGKKLPDNHGFAFTFEGTFLAREKKMWYKNEKHLQENTTLV